MVAFELSLVVTALFGAMAAVFWMRVAASRSLRAAGKLDGTERLAVRDNRRAFRYAVLASALTLLLAVAALVAGRGAGAF